MPKTNKERLQDNNVELQNIKAGIDNLPEYVDIEYIHSTGSGVNVLNTLPPPTSNRSLQTGFENIDIGKKYVSVLYYYASGSTSMYGNYLINIETKEAILLQTNSSSRNCAILCETDEYVYVGKPTNNTDYSSTYTIYKVDTQTKQVTSYTQSLSCYWANNNNYDYYLTIANSRNRSCSLLKFNTETEQLELKSSLAGQSYYLPVAYNLLLIYNPSADTSIKCYKILDENNFTTITNTFSKVNGFNFAGTKIFMNGNIYSLNDDLSVGDLIKSNAYTYISKQYLYALNDKYYVYNNVLYTFNETDNTFEVYGNNYYVVGGNKLYKRDANNSNNLVIYEFTSTGNIIGFKLDGNIYFRPTRTTVDSNDVKSGTRITNINGTIINGTMPDNGALNYTPTTSQQTIPAGYTSGGVVEAITDGFGNLTIPSFINVLYEREDEFDMELPDITGINWEDVLQWVKPAMKLKTESKWHYSDWEDEDTGEYYEFLMSIGSQYGEEESLSKVIGYNEDDGKYHLNLNIIDIYQNNYSNFDYKLMLKLLHPTMPTYKNCDITFNVSAPTDVFYDLYVRGNNISSVQDVTISVKDTNDNDIQYDAVYRTKFGGIRITTTTDKDGTILVTYNGVTETRPLDTTNNMSNEIYTYRFGAHEGNIEFN